MADADALARALAGRYRLEQELGRGGMAVVYLATDLQHDRLVALKVMLPEIGSLMGADRFRREIRLIAGLQHPHILPVFDSGEADGMLWFTMPFIRGESLRQRLERVRQLPPETAARIAGHVAAALDEAHRRGILHRDVKPENILLTESDDAMLADFGVARPVLRGTGATLTAEGNVIGTPAYMSPEQLSGEGVIDGRADVYALGCVVHEMLTGRPPALGESVANPAVARAIAMRTQDRYATAGDFTAALAVRPRRAIPRRAMIAAAVTVAVLGGGALWLGQVRKAEALDRSLVAVLPFRVASADTALGYLGEGMVDLLAVKFTGEGGPRAVDPRAAVSAWKRMGTATADAPPRAARALGAGLVIGDGAVVGTERSITLTATLAEVGGGRGTAASVTGPADSITVLVDRLASQLLADRAGEQSRALAGVTNLAALRAYLSGRVNSRRGHYDQAVRDFDRALDEDSTFALAALGAVKLNSRGGALRHDVNAIASRNRASFSPVDRVLLDATIGPAWPAPFSQIGSIQLLRRATELAPDNAEAWFGLGDYLLHFSGANGIDSGLSEARAALTRALAIDSSYFLPIEHLARYAIAVRDTALLRQAMRRIERADTTADWFTTIRWNAAVLFGDSTTVRAMRAEMQRALASGQPCRCSPDLIAPAGQQFALAPGDALLGARLLYAQSPRDHFARRVFVSALVNAGRPGEAAAVAGSGGDDGSGDATSLMVMAFQGAINDGDSGAAARASAALAGIERGRASPGERTTAMCARGLIAAVRRDSAATARALADLQRLPAMTDPGLRDDVAYCVSLGEAMLAALEHRPDARARVERADSIAIWSFTTYTVPGFFVEAMAAEAAGDLHLARRIMDREIVVQAQDPLLFYSASLRERGRLARLDGDTAAARRWWGEYLSLRANPELQVRPAVDSVRQALAALK